MCPFAVRVPIRFSLADFLGSMITFTITRPEGLVYFQFRLSGWICLPQSAPTTFNAPFRRCAEVSLLRLHIARTGSNGILTVSAIAFTFRIMLRTRLTLNRLALFRKPWSCGGGASHPPYRYLYLHLLFHTLQQSSRFTFYAEWNAPLPMFAHPIASVRHLMPDYYPRQTPRLVSCYALFK